MVKKALISIKWNIKIKMTHYNSRNVKLSNFQLNKLKSAINNATKLIQKLSSNMICNLNDGINFPQKLLQLIDKLLSLSNNSSANIILYGSQNYLIF